MLPPDLHIHVAALLLGLSVPALGAATATAVGFWWPPATATRRAFYVLLAIVAVGAVLRLGVLPVRMATMYTGFINTDAAVHLTNISQYGAGTAVLYHVFFQFLPADHLTLMHVNAALGALTLLFFGTWAAEYLRDRRAGVLAAAFAALLPVFLRNDTSDANNVPCLFWLFAGVVLWQAHLRTGKRGSLVAALPMLALAAAGRPEFSLVVVATVVLTAWGGAAGRPLPRRAGSWALFGAAWLLLIAPHLVYTYQTAARYAATAALPGFAWHRWASPIHWLWESNLLTTPRLFPLALPALGLVALWRPGPAGRRAAIALVVLMAVTLVAYIVDVDWANVARVHVPIGLAAAALGAAGALRLATDFKRAWVLPAVCAGVAATALPSALLLFAPTNEDHEQAFLQDVHTALPRTPLALVARLGDDGPTNPGSGEPPPTHLMLPAYWFQPRDGNRHTLSISRFMAWPPTDRPAYFLRSTRCYAEFRTWGSPPPRGDNLHPACRRLLDGYELQPIIERVVENRGDLWLAYYGDAPTLTLGLYRIGAPRAGAPGAPPPPAGGAPRATEP